jgi:hypothetical protein
LSTCAMAEFTRNGPRLDWVYFAIPRAYSAAFNECSEPSIATSIFENFEFSADNLVVKQTKTKDISINPQF